MASTRNWTDQAMRHLAESIAECGNLDVPCDKFPLGRVEDWKAVEAAMAAKGHTISFDALQGKWGREARGRLLKAKSSTAIQDGTNAAAVLLILAEKAYPQTLVAAPTATVTGPVAGSASRPADQAGASGPLHIIHTKADFKKLTKKNREETLASIRQNLEILREVMEEEDGEETVTVEMLNLAAGV